MTIIVCIHGAGGGSWEYDLWRPVFETAGYCLVARDLQPAAAGLASTTVDDYLAQIDLWTPKQEPFVLVGASMGGLLALKISEKISPSAVVLASAIPPAGLVSDRCRKPYQPIIEWANGPLEETQTALFDSDVATIQWAWQRWRNESGIVLQQLNEQITIQRPTCPTLVILGEKDQDIPYQQGLMLAQWANADVHLYSKMSHVGPLLSRRATEVAQAVVLWFQARFL